MSEGNPLSIQSTGRVRPWKLFASMVCLFLILVALRREILFSPPYYDFAVGIWPEADYLARTNFNYAKLRFEEPHCLDPDGGPRSYMTSIIPTLLAVAMKTPLDASGLILVFHLFQLACTAITGVILFHALRAFAPSSLAWAGVVATLTTPVFCIHMDLTSMEASLTAAAVAVVWAFQRKAYVAAALLGLLAFFIKPAGLFLTIAGGSVLLLYLLLESHAGCPSEARRRKIGIAAHAWAFVIELAIIDLGGSLGSQIRPSITWMMFWIWCPDWTFLTLATLTVGAVYWISAVRNSGTKNLVTDSLRSRFRSLLPADPAILFVLIAFVGLVAAATRVSLIPRYLVVTVPLLYILASKLFSIRFSSLGACVFSMIAVLNLLNWNGRLFPDLLRGMEAVSAIPGPFLAGEGSVLERSHEYQADHQANMEATRVIADQPGNEAVLAPIPFAYFFAYPSFGYPVTSRAGYTTTGFKKTAPWFGDYRDFLADRPSQVLVIRCANFFSNARLLIDMPWPRPEDEVLYESPTGHVTVFRVVLPEKGPEKDVWYDRLRSLRTRDAATLYHAFHSGGLSEMRETLSRLQSATHPAPEFKVIADALAYRAGKSSTPHTPIGPLLHERPLPKGARADTDYRRELAESLRSPDALWEAGMTALRYMDLESAAGYFSRVATREPGAP